MDTRLIVVARNASTICNGFLASSPGLTTYKHLSNRLVEAHADTTVRQLSQNRCCKPALSVKKLRNWWNVHQIMHKGSCPLFHMAKERAKVTFEDFEVPHQHQRRKSSLAAYFRRLYNDYICIYQYNIYIYRKGRCQVPIFHVFRNAVFLLHHAWSFMFIYL